MLKDLLKEISKRYLEAYGVSGFLNLMLSNILDYNESFRDCPPPDEPGTITITDLVEQIEQLQRITWMD